MIRYSLDLAKFNKWTNLEALNAMKENAAGVAEQVGASEVFVTVWVDEELRRAKAWEGVKLQKTKKPAG